VIDRHNQACRFELWLEKYWLTLVPNFRLHTTILRMNMADCWIIMGHAMAGRSTTTAVRNTLCPFKNLLVCFLSNCLTLLNLKKSSVPITILMQEDSTGQVSSPMSSKRKTEIILYLIFFLQILMDYFTSQYLFYLQIKPRCSHCLMEGKANSGGREHHSCNVCKKAFCCPSAQNSYRDCFL